MDGHGRASFCNKLVAAAIVSSLYHLLLLPVHELLLLLLLVGVILLVLLLREHLGLLLLELNRVDACEHAFELLGLLLNLGLLVGRDKLLCANIEGLWRLLVLLLLILEPWGETTIARRVLVLVGEVIRRAH